MFIFVTQYTQNSVDLLHHQALHNASARLMKPMPTKLDCRGDNADDTTVVRTSWNF